MKVFLAYSFRDLDRDLVADVEQLFESHDVRVVTGERLGGQELTDAVKERIEGADGLVALLTRRAQDPDTGEWMSHPWVRDELKHARDHGVPAIGLVETGVSTGGMDSEREYIPYDRDEPLSAFIALSQTLGLWKRQRGRRLKVQILPEDLARLVRYGNGDVTCRYRFFIEDTRTDWQDAFPIPETGGTFIWVNGVRDQCLVQLKIDLPSGQWESDATSQWIQVKCREGNP